MHAAIRGVARFFTTVVIGLADFRFHISWKLDAWLVRTDLANTFTWLLISCLAHRVIKPKICRHGPTGLWAGHAPGNQKLFNTDLCQTDTWLCLFATGIKRATSWLSSSLGWLCQKKLRIRPKLFKRWILRYIHPINLYPVDKYQGNQLHYPLDRDLSVG